MDRLQSHLRNKLLAGVLTAVPVVIIIYAAVLAEGYTQPLTKPLGFTFPGLGILLVLVGTYLLGLVVTSLLGQFFVGIADRLLKRLPVVGMVYQAWKEVLVVPPGEKGTFDQVVLVPSAEGVGSYVGFTSGKGLAGDPETICVFVPGAPNPLTGRLLLVPRSAVRPMPVPVEEAVKFVLSTGNHLPAGLARQ